MVAVKTIFVAALYVDGYMGGNSLKDLSKSWLSEKGDRHWLHFRPPHLRVSRAHAVSR